MVRTTSCWRSLPRRGSRPDSSYPSAWTRRVSGQGASNCLLWIGTSVWIFCAAACIDHARHGNTTSLLNSSNVTAGAAWGLLIGVTTNLLLETEIGSYVFSKHTTGTRFLPLHSAQTEPSLCILYAISAMWRFR